MNLYNGNFEILGFKVLTDKETRLLYDLRALAEIIVNMNCKHKICLMLSFGSHSFDLVIKDDFDTECSMWSELSGNQLVKGEISLCRERFHRLDIPSPLILPATSEEISRFFLNLNPNFNLILAYQKNDGCPEYWVGLVIKPKTGRIAVGGIVLIDDHKPLAVFSLEEAC
jgi:hypothetical protein